MAKKTSKTLVPKPPVVTIMGHVDHGKTTLLDTIRKSRVAFKEAGGITQHIGAYQVVHNNQPITFIDTPGHAAFSKMRAHGVSITDIVVLVVAADDGVKPQTKESIKLIKQAKIPVIVAINKIDIKTASPEMVKAQLVEEEIYVEGYGGNVPVVEISARDGLNIDLLLETIQLFAEVEDLKADPEANLEAVVIESGLKQNQGPTATFLVLNGTLKMGEEVVSVDDGPKVEGKIKRLLTDTQKIVKTAGPSMPVEVLGLKSVPQAGTIFSLPATAQAVADKYAKAPIETPQLESEKTDSEAENSQEEVQKIKVILLADTQGSLEAILANLSQEVEIISSATGEVTESDVLMAHSTKSVIVAFNVKVNTSAKRLAEIEKVRIRSYQIIYKLLEEFEQQVFKLLEPTFDETELGMAKVKAVFNMKNDVIAGCVITKGAVSVNDRVHLMRNDKIIKDSRIVSVKQGKVDVKKVEENQECGIIFKPSLEVQEGDYIQAFKPLES